MAIRPAAIQAMPTDLLTTNQWTLDIDILPGEKKMVSPQFDSLDGIGVAVGTIEKAEGGSGLVYKFSNHAINHKPITISRKRDGTAQDAYLQQYVDTYIRSGAKRNGTMYKYHNGKLIRKIIFVGLGLFDSQHPSYNSTTSDAEEIRIQCTVDYHEEEPIENGHGGEKFVVS